MAWILGRMKAWMAIAVPAIVTALITSLEQAMGFEVPLEFKTMILSAVTGLVVYAVPNK